MRIKTKGKALTFMEEEDCVTSPKSICTGQATLPLDGLVWGGLIYNSSTLCIYSQLVCLQPVSVYLTKFSMYNYWDTNSCDYLAINNLFLV